MFLANIELALSTLESADDITAADIAPRPKNETIPGVKYRITSGRINL
jgi:hypothetical protein